MIEPIFVIMMFDTLNARDLSLSLFFAFLSSYGSFSCVSFSDSFTFLLICFLKNSSLHERQERTFPSLPLSLFSYYFVLEKGREHLVIVFFEGDDDDDGFAGLSLLLRGTAKHR